MKIFYMRIIIDVITTRHLIMFSPSNNIRYKRSVKFAHNFMIKRIIKEITFNKKNKKVDRIMVINASRFCVYLTMIIEGNVIN